MLQRFVAFLIQLGISAGVLWLGVAWVSRNNPRNTFGRAAIVALVLCAAYYLTGGFWLHLFVIPWLVYAAIWLAVIMGNYGIGFLHAVLLALALSVLSWLTTVIVGIPPLKG